eukprot:6197809-Pleurochrysis_carterae.AAC.3
MLTCGAICAALPKFWIPYCAWPTQPDCATDREPPCRCVHGPAPAPASAPRPHLVASYIIQRLFDRSGRSLYLDPGKV